jgi:hypothetical protein
MKQEFQDWVDSVQSILQEHNIRENEPINVELPPFEFTADTSLARRMNRLSTPVQDELSASITGVDVPKVAETPAVTTTPTALKSSAPVTENRTSIPDVYNRSRTAEANFHAWARSEYPNESIVSFLPTDTSKWKGSISSFFNAHSVKSENLEPLREYLILSRDNTRNLDQKVEFMDGSVKHVDTEMLFESDSAVEHSLELIRSSDSAMYVIEYIA